MVVEKLRQYSSIYRSLVCAQMAPDIFNASHRLVEGSPKVAPEHMIAVLLALCIFLVSFAVFGNNGSMDIFFDNTSPRMKAFVPEPGEDAAGQFICSDLTLIMFMGKWIVVFRGHQEQTYPIFGESAHMTDPLGGHDDAAWFGVVSYKDGNSWNLRDRASRWSPIFVPFGRLLFYDPEYKQIRINSSKEVLRRGGMYLTRSQGADQLFKFETAHIQWEDQNISDAHGDLDEDGKCTARLDNWSQNLVVTGGEANVVLL
eukprot:CAMPEP_0172171158 /NCGR_PEP_ID=MMETSP1050-20130122/11732_1 /TAXON_ID=233186 /ORGANISM="Cryptomonas curvata, Strain CCAP979/52" /LENGTH=257 /DNA_ID=CAMNT_0012842549 /DNA_START=3995 /DNA_END=4768 /DNA_ORIENTATION=+